MADNLSNDQWTTLLDQLKSHYIPSLYQLGKRMHVDFSAAGGGMRAVVYFTPQTVSMEGAIRILRQRGMQVFDDHGNSIVK
jgi:hypothetical protein